MAAVAPAADQTANLLQKLALDSHAKKDDTTDAAKKGAAPYAPVANGEAQNLPRSLTPLPQEVDSNYFYGYSAPHAYYYNGYDPSVTEWDSRYATREGAEVQPSVYGEMYHGYGFPYGAYASPASPVPAVGHDGQLYGPQHYQYAASYYQPSVPTPTDNQNSTAHGELSTSVGVEQPLVGADTVKAIATTDANGNDGSATLKQGQNLSSVTSNTYYGRGSLQGSLSANGYQNSRYDFNGVQSPMLWYDMSTYNNVNQRIGGSSLSSPNLYGGNNSARSQNRRPSGNLLRPTSAMGPTAAGYLNRVYPNNRLYSQYGQYGSALKAGLGFGPNSLNPRTGGRYGPVVDNKNKTGGRNSSIYGFNNMSQDGFSELNRGPRSSGFKNQKPFGSTVTIAVKGQALPTVGKQDSTVPDKEQFNREDFPVTYKDAKFFIIKSYSEDDIHRSIKYNVWASTPNGNKKLDAGFREAQDKADGCPVFLFFSVNTSGQFVGVAEMVGSVDFNKTVDYWQQDKWNGCFPLKWHIVKDVPNSILKHIILENNDNKPVTNSRDTQEVKLEQGLEMLKIFKDYVCKTSVLDDFAFYEHRQKLMQDKRAKQQQLPNQPGDERNDAVVTGERDEGKPKLQKPVEPVSILNRENATNSSLAEKKHLENGIALSATEKRVVANSTSNGD